MGVVEKIEKYGDLNAGTLSTSTSEAGMFFLTSPNADFFNNAVNMPL